MTVSRNNTEISTHSDDEKNVNGCSEGNDEVEEIDALPDSVESTFVVTYRSAGLGLYGAVMRYAGMPLEKIALFMNSAQVSGNNQLRQAFDLTFQDGQKRSFLAPYKVVGPASGVAWFLQYSVMGMVFQVCDKSLSSALGIKPMHYGAQLMEDPENDEKTSRDLTTTTKICTKLILAPIFAGTIESTVSNRAEVQRYFGLKKFCKMENSLKWNPFSRYCGQAFLANASRNCIMSGTTFVITPTLYRQYFPQEQKSTTSLFWFGLGINIFLGNAIAITQQALWGRALDYAASPMQNKGTAARNINYSTVIKDGLAKEGYSAFFTGPKWASRVLMNAPVQGTLPWFYNDVLPLAEGGLREVVKGAYRAVSGKTPGSSK
mmetsp:Transcript_6370/g.7411  ORF Transcript_6370/g.7411 Transcript_6370/m.7411 type:complete len:376 (+) Transcript_6370:67-1194(+)|eukprot:CAMPEP_0198263172 /NCGR_PEP_ID=MMETSP1447-20131203/11573_1 /TAXON_ID=420782 /ORGANISM="Chaetoceros dichaeta, Strain CCMP1751" /LENGTH=375 /DNA_ID=CAMNT_0043951679 /DNA_START=67 /DNA_END=1194 /DNA_ORIENTATION=-